jgi:hypothetical protein
LALIGALEVVLGIALIPLGVWLGVFLAEPALDVGCEKELFWLEVWYL